MDVHEQALAGDGKVSNLLARMKFSGTWRDYQAFALEAFESLMADQRVHVVAAPGSGKTILGLELVRELGRPALVLAPTRAIREQWCDRLVPLFLAGPPGDADVSQDLDRIATLTAATYQSLHAIWAGEDRTRFAALVARLHAIGPITLVLDEAHHLRREWWHALQALVGALAEAKIVALTATPPYDAPFAEWTRYEEMCGPIDLEIGVPELVRNGDLCPHQDHVIFSIPDDDTLALLQRRRDGMAELLESLRCDIALLDYLETHRWLIDPEGDADVILESPELLSAMLIHLASGGRHLPDPPLKLLGVRRRDLPSPSPFWTEILLNGLLFQYSDSFLIGEERTTRLRAILHEHGLIEGGRVRLGETRSTFKRMAASLAKLGSITAIARHEAANLGSDLRLVILTDHVRAGELSRIDHPGYRPPKLGVVPIFEALRRAAIDGQPLGVLTGTLLIVPVTALPALERILSLRGLAASQWRHEAINACTFYVQVILSGEAERQSVEMMTELFETGSISILIGTQALLGEGWDAPTINSLILASNSAAFMLSNQMRGRAIRIDPARPDKVANIWHLATVEPFVRPITNLGAHFDWGRLDQGDDVTSDEQLLERRFRAFEGVANISSNRIESGLERLDLPPTNDLDLINRTSFDRARDRMAIAARWRVSIGGAGARAHVREIASTNYSPRSLSWHHTLHWLCATAASGGALAAANALTRSYPGQGIWTLAMAAAGAISLVAVPKLALALWLQVRNGSVEGNLSQVGRAVIIGLHEANVLSGFEREDATIEVQKRASGRIDLIAHGLSRASERAVMQAMAEVLGPVGNPRYLLVRKSWLGARSRHDYHAVPTVIAARKDLAEAFHHEWNAKVGPSQLIFTRTAGGRLALLRARARSFAAGFQRRIERRSAWL